MILIMFHLFPADSSLVISSSPPPTSSDTESAHQPANSQHESTTTMPATLPDLSAESEALTTTLSQQVQATAESELPYNGKY